MKIPSRTVIPNGNKAWGYNNYNGIGTPTVVTGTVSGASDPNYNVKIARLNDASLPYSFQVVECNGLKTYSFNETYFDSYWGRTRVTDGYSYLRSPFALLSAIPSNTAADDLALKRLKTKASSFTKEFKALVPLGEIGETRRLIGQVANASLGLVQGLLDLKHGKIRDAAKRAGDAWLTFSFGVSPTINDINNLLETIDDQINGGFRTCQIHGKNRVRWNEVYTRTTSSEQLASYMRALCKYSSEHEYSVKYSAGLKIDIRSANNYGIANKFGLNFGELIPTAWELVPFSWIVDYFATTGDFLSDVFETPAGSTFYCTKSVKYTRSTVFSANVVPIWKLPGGGSQPSTCKNYSLTSIDEGQRIKETFFKRTVLSSIPHRALRFKSIDEIGVNSVKRLLNLASLLVK